MRTTRPHERRRVGSRLAAAAALTLAFGVGAAAPAAAHASLVSTTPAAGRQLDEAPARIVVTFTEPVTTTAASVRLFDGAGDRLDTGPVERDGNDVRVDVGDLDAGTYITTWRVTSADGHPIQGAFTFQVGDGGPGRPDTQALTRRLLAEQGGETTTGFVYAVQRAVVFAAVIVLVGGAAFVTALWPAGRGDRRARRVLTWAWAAAVVSTALGIGLHGAYTAGLGVASAFDPSVIGDELSTRLGESSLLRLALLVVAGVLVARLLGRDGAPAVAVRAAGAAVAVGILATFGFGGHAATGDLVALAVAADVVHLAAVSVWLGGLAVLATGVLPAGDPGLLTRVATRFSGVAFLAVGVIVATGTFQGWRQTRSIDALDGTTYGRLLLVKVALVAALVALAWTARRWVQRRRADTSVAAFARTIGLEVALAVVVVGVTALLVNAQPGRTALAQPFSTTLEAGPLLVDVTVDPANAGPADVHLYTLDQRGHVAEVDDMAVALRLPARDVGPLTVPVRRAGPGHFAVYGFDLPFPGDWVLDVSARVGGVDQYDATTRVRIR